MLLEFDYSILNDLCEVVLPYRELNCFRDFPAPKQTRVKTKIVDLQKKNKEKEMPINLPQIMNLVNVSPTCPLATQIDDILIEKDFNIAISIGDLFCISLLGTKNGGNQKTILSESFTKISISKPSINISKNEAKINVNIMGFTFSTSESLSFSSYFFKVAIYKNLIENDRLF